MNKKEEISLNEIKGSIRERIKAQYGSIDKFLRSEDGAKFGGLKIKPYLYPAGSPSYEVLKNLAEFFGVGTISRKLHVVKTTTYFIIRK